MGDYVEGSVYFYAPNKPAPIVFCVLFAISGIVHFMQTKRYGSWRVTGLMPWASFYMVVGFAFRAVGAWNYRSVPFLITNQVLIQSAPPIYALINYMVLSRILYYVPYKSPMHPGRVLTTFLAADTLCEVLLVNGAIRSINSGLSEEHRKIGSDLVKAALLLQALMFASFLVIGLNFQRRCAQAQVLNKNLRFVLYVMYASSGIITARCIYRIVEYFEGINGPVFRNEAYFWVFEASLMFVNTLLLNIFHPGKHLPRSNKVFLAQDGITELRGPGWDAKRPFLSTLLDPFDIWGLIRGHDSKTKFWELTREELDLLNERKRIERAEKAATPRSAIGKVLDPFHLWGNTGKFRKLADRMDGEEPIDLRLVGKPKPYVPYLDGPREETKKMGGDAV